MRICTLCGKEKSKEHFNKWEPVNWCKPCYSTYRQNNTYKNTHKNCRKCKKRLLLIEYETVKNGKKHHSCNYCRFDELNSRCSKCLIYKLNDEFNAYYRKIKKNKLCKICNPRSKTDNQKETAKKYREMPENRKRATEIAKINNKKRRKIDIQFRLKSNLRGRLYNILKGRTKGGSAVGDLGCTVEYLKLHLEKQFKLGMSWENYGKKEGQWSIDHILPLSKFDLTDRQQFVKVCHFSNLQPLWHVDNIRKSNKSNL